jgi:predicted transposase/invertase (TIGR01784 family)
MTNEYDKVIKENLEAVFLPLAKKLLNIESDLMEEIPDDLQTTIERFPDLLKKVKHNDSSKDFILHIEFQTADDTEMPARMLEYKAILYRKYKLQVLQQVFFIGKGRSGMKNSINLPNIQFSYGLLSFQEISYRKFIDSESPEEVLMAILADFEDQQSESIIERILNKINNSNLGTLQKQKNVKHLSILSKLRNLQPIVDILIEKIMALHINYQEDAYYKRGKKQGKIEGKIEIIKALLKKAVLSHLEIAEVTGVSIEFVNKIATQDN